jgi:hypothetical protein
MGEKHSQNVTLAARLNYQLILGSLFWEYLALEVCPTDNQFVSFLGSIAAFFFGKRDSYSWFHFIFINLRFNQTFANLWLTMWNKTW